MLNHQLYNISKDPDWNIALNALLDPSVSEIMSNGPGSFFLKRRGRREKMEGISETNIREYTESVERGLIPLVQSNFGYEENNFLHEGPIMYEFGGHIVRGRCHIVLPPACDSPQVTITKKARALTEIEQIAAQGSMANEMLNFLKDAVRANLTIVISGGTGAGKDLHVDTKIPTIEGMKTVGTAKPGDILFDEKGNRTLLLKKYRPMDKVHYRLKFDNGREVKAGTGHLWPVTILEGSRKGEKANLTTNEIFEYGVIVDGRPSFAIEGLTNSVDYDKSIQPVNPFMQGVSLSLGEEKDDNKVGRKLLESYKVASKYQRIALIEGVVSVSGSKQDENGKANIKLKSLQLIEDFREVISSLGWKVEGISRENDNYVFGFYPEEGVLAVDSVNVDKRHYILEVEEISDNPEDYWCFMVDSPSHLFLHTEDYIPTHNTTMLQAMTKLIPDSTRMGVAEDIPELELDQPDTTYLHSQPARPGMDPNKTAALSWVVQQFQRMRTDKLIIGETRGKEFAYFLVAANSGQEGSMTTIHADTPKRCLEKMSLFALQGSERQPIKAVNLDIAQTIDLIVQLIILPDGRHRVSSITAVSNTVSDGDEARITTADLYKYDVKSDSHFKAGSMPDALREKLDERDIDISKYLSTPIGNVLQKTAPIQAQSSQPSRSSIFGKSSGGGLPTDPRGRTL